MLGECLGRARWRHRHLLLPQEIPGKLVEADGSNESYHRKNRPESDLNTWVFWSFAEETHFLLPELKRKRPRLIESQDARRSALPRKLLTTSLRCDSTRGNGSNGPPWECADAARLDHREPYVGYWDGMDAEQTIAEIECLERIFAVPDIRPLGPSDLAAANRRHDEMLAQSPDQQC